MPTPNAGPNTNVDSQPNVPTPGVTTVKVTERDPITGEVVSVEQREGPNAPPDPWDRYTSRWREEYSKDKPRTVTVLREIGVTWDGEERRAQRTVTLIKRLVERRWPPRLQEEDIVEIVADSNGVRINVVTDHWVDGTKQKGLTIPLTPPGSPSPEYWPHPTGKC